MIKNGENSNFFWAFWVKMFNGNFYNFEFQMIKKLIIDQTKVICIDYNKWIIQGLENEL